MQAREFGGEFHGVAMPPGAPEIVLPAVVATMRATAGKLHDDGAAFPIVGVAPVIDEFPTDAASIQIPDDGAGQVLDDASAFKWSLIRASRSGECSFPENDP